MRWYLICSRAEAVIERHVLAEILDSWLADHLAGTAGGLFTADEARRQFPKAVARWEADDDAIALRSQALIDEIAEMEEASSG